MSSRLLCTLAAAALTFSTSGFSQRLIVLPSPDSTSQQAGAYTLSPFVQDKLFSVGINNIGVYQRNDANPTNANYWVVSRAGANALQILDYQFNVIKTVNFGLTPGAAAMSPDGHTFIITYGSGLKIYDAIAQVELQLTNNIDFGPSADDAVISHDSTKAFIFSVAAQRITQIDLVNRVVLGTLSTPGANSGYLTLGPNGLLYCAFETNLYEIDPTIPLSSNSVTQKLTFGGRAGRAVITPDGTRAIVPNILSSSGQQTAPPLINYFNLTNGSNAPATTPPELVGLNFDHLVVASNTLAFATATTSPRSLYQVQIPVISATTGVLPAPTLSQAFFSSKGNLETAQTLAVSGEYPTSSRLYVPARLSQISSLVPDGIFEIDVAHNAYVSTVPVSAFPVGQASVVRPVRTSAATAPATLLSLGVYQPPIAQKARSRPMGVQVLGADGLPIAGVPVTFQSTLAGMTFEGADAFGNTTTNSYGYAFVVAIAPAANGQAVISVSTPNLTSSSTFSLTVGTSSGGGGGGGTGTGTAAIAIYGGNGQAQSEGITFRFPLAVQVTDSNGNPVAGVPVTWNVTGPARNLDGTFADPNNLQNSVTVTGTNGVATQDIFPNIQTGLRAGFSSISVDASTATAGTVTFNAISYQIVTPDGTTVPKPSAILNVPTDSRTITAQAGSLLKGAIQVEFTSSGIALGAPIAGLAIEMIPPDGTPANSPSASCSPIVDALSDNTGLASCDLRIGSIVGTGNIRAVLGGNLGEVYFTLVVTPGSPGAITKVSGDSQTGTSNGSLASPLVVKVTDSNSQPLAGQTVTWTLVSGAGSAIILNATSVTNAAGQASTSVNLGPTPGQFQIKAQVQGGNNPSVTFTGTNGAPVSALTKVSGDGQSAQVGATFPAALVVQVSSTTGSVQSVPVTFSVVSGAVSLVGTATVTTNANGQAAINVQAGSTAGTAIVRATTGQYTADFTLTVQPLQIFTVNDIHNVNTNAPGSLSPGGLYRIYAVGVAPNLNGVQTANLLFGPLPLQMNNVTVQIGTVFVPIFQLENIGGKQAVVVQAPFELTPGSTDSVTIRINGVPNTVNNIPILPVQPGIFETVDANSNRYVVAQHMDGSYVTEGAPAKFGEQIRAYFTGGGKLFAVGTPPTTGLAGPGAPYTGNIVVGVDGVGAQVISTRYTPGYVGVWDVVFQIQTTLGPGDNSHGLDAGPTQPFAIALSPGGGAGYVAVSSSIPLSH